MALAATLMVGVAAAAMGRPVPVTVTRVSGARVPRLSFCTTAAAYLVASHSTH